MYMSLKRLRNYHGFFQYPEDNQNKLKLPNKDEKFRQVLENVLKALDPSIREVNISQDVDNAYVIHLQNKSIVIQDGDLLTTDFLSSGTKAGVEVSTMLSSLIQKDYHFYYCDEKFSYIHSDIEKAILSVMIEYVGENDQLFFTTHNTDVLDMNLPKHTFTFLRKDITDSETPIKPVNASSYLKRNTDSLRNAVENDAFSVAPALEFIYDIINTHDKG